MYKFKTAIFFLGSLFVSCNNPHDAETQLGKQYKTIEKQLLPFVIKKPDGISYEERFSKKVASFYENVNKQINGTISFIQKTDSVVFFSYDYKDLTSLFEHYQTIGGYYKANQNDSIYFVNLLYHTPRFTKEEIKEKSVLLFQEMITTGNVKKYIGDRNFIHTPNKDFYYNVNKNKWDYTEDSSWNFLKEEQRR